MQCIGQFYDYKMSNIAATSLHQHIFNETDHRHRNKVGNDAKISKLRHDNVWGKSVCSWKIIL